MKRVQFKHAGAIVLAAAVCSTTAARADQGGVSFWVPGIYASMAAVPPDPGFSMPSTTAERLIAQTASGLAG